MLITVVTPTFNSERYVRSTLESIWTDDSIPGENVEHIVVDGGSDDRTLAIVAEYPSKVITGRDRGMYDALNKGLAAMTGDVFGYVNSDDEVTEGGLRAVREAFGRAPSVNWLTAPSIIIDGEGKALATLRPPRWLSAERMRALGWNCFPQPSTYFRADFVRRLGGFPEDLRLAGDYDLFLRALERQRPIYLRKPLSRFRLHETNLTKNHEAMYAESDRIADAGQMNRGLYLLRRWSTKLQVNAISPRWALGKRTGRVRY